MRRLSASRRVFGAVRVSVPTSRVDSLVRRYWLALGSIGLIVLSVVALAGMWLARWVSRPLTDLRDATRAAEGGTAWKMNLTPFFTARPAHRPRRRAKEAPD